MTDEGYFKTTGRETIEKMIEKNEYPYRVVAGDEFFRYICVQCTLCCLEETPQLFPDDLKRLPDYLGISESEFLKKYCRLEEYEDGFKQIVLKKQGEGCIFLKNNGCVIHDQKPLRCKAQPLGSTRFKNPYTGREYYLLNDHGCPGFINEDSLNPTPLLVFNTTNSWTPQRWVERFNLNKLFVYHQKPHEDKKKWNQWVTEKARIGKLKTKEVQNG